MTTQQFTPPPAALVAIDIAKNRHEILIEPGPGMRRRRLSVLNNRAEHDRLVATLRDLGKPVMVGFEPTGNYHRVLAHRLIAAGFEVRLISSMALARTRTLRDVKTGAVKTERRTTKYNPSPIVTCGSE